ncbi:hypothetical protein E2C01_066284 [Portunus trituberculatus]|uniref:Uncharacterized protein n=1 Tax=Portunus trituberculatus TaxID=210409 RepID=A0A5B7HL40_PORTR|nr:hypothetical protein [Portunus trituberculatus]
MHYVFTVTAKVDITHQANTLARRNNRDRPRNSRRDYRARVETPATAMTKGEVMYPRRAIRASNVVCVLAEWRGDKWHCCTLITFHLCGETLLPATPSAHTFKVKDCAVFLPGNMWLPSTWRAPPGSQDTAHVRSVRAWPHTTAC